MNRDRVFLQDVLQGRRDAIELVERLAFVSQVWDDLIDRDGPQYDLNARINEAFLNCLVHLPRNAFYQQYAAELQPVIEHAIFDWLAANQLERGTRDEQAVAYVIRDSFALIVTRCATLIGGVAWGCEVAYRARRYVHDEPLDTYLKEHPP